MRKVLSATCRIVAVVTSLVITGCGMDSVELGEYVKKEMQHELTKKTGLKSLQLTDCRLIKQDGIKYAGIAHGKISEQEVVFDVKCQYDGRTVIWESELTSDSMMVLAAKEKTKEYCDIAKESWPEIKAEARKQYNAAKGKASEWYGRAKGAFTKDTKTESEN